MSLHSVEGEEIDAGTRTQQQGALWRRPRSRAAMESRRVGRAVAFSVISDSARPAPVLAPGPQPVGHTVIPGREAIDGSRNGMAQLLL